MRSSNGGGVVEQIRPIKEQLKPIASKAAKAAAETAQAGVHKATELIPGNRPPSRIQRIKRSKFTPVVLVATVSAAFGFFGKKTAKD